ncbi:MAG TPA: integrin alpha, partial [bacterium]|nr:integrin alpha [bacterium]
LYGSSAGITGTITAATIGTTVSGAAFKGPGTNYIAGETVRAAGDVDADGYDDLIITATSTFTSTVQGKAYLVYGE